MNWGPTVIIAATSGGDNRRFVRLRCSRQNMLRKNGQEEPKASTTCCSYACNAQTSPRVVCSPQEQAAPTGRGAHTLSSRVADYLEPYGWDRSMKLNIKKSSKIGTQEICICDSDVVVLDVHCSNLVEGENIKCAFFPQDTMTVPMPISSC